MYAVCEFGGHLDLKAKYVYANGMLLAKYDESPADTHYYHHDGLGSVIGMTNEDGNVEQSYFYDDFGNSLGTWGSVSNSYLYTSQEYDGVISGLYNLRARYYDPGIGRFVSEDPELQAGLTADANCLSCKTISPSSYLFTPGNRNTYVYVLNNSVNLTDIEGMSPIKKPTLWCLLAIIGEWIGTSRSSDKYRHCILGCTIYRLCGPEYCIAAGPLKELLDIIKRRLGRPEHVEFADILATLAGCACGASIFDCDYCCECVVGYEP